MSVRLLHPDEYELVERSSIDSQETFNLDDADFASHPLNKPNFLRRDQSILSRLLSIPFTGLRRIRSAGRPSRRRGPCCGRLSSRRIWFILHTLLGILVAVIILTFIFRPSYTRLPPHYQSLQDAMLQSKTPGRGNPRKEKVFIAISLYDQGGDLARGRWGRDILYLVDLLGEDNVYLSIYENDAGEEAGRALDEFNERVTCNKTLLFEDHLNLSEITSITLPDGTTRTKRIAYLAEVRNRALRPLDKDPSLRYDRLLYLNDVYFNPTDVVQLLFSTNIGYDGRTQYRAACAVDFINPFKFYDTFATRDLQGYGIGLPFYPWFTATGSGESRKDVLDQKDAVRVRSCWGGMVAFDAKYFQEGTSQASPIHRRRHAVERRFLTTTDVDRQIQKHDRVRFRAEKDLFWEASECCLVHADIQDDVTNVDEVADTGIYMNPYVRVSYDPRSQSWLKVTRRFERLYSIAHRIASKVAGLPEYNPRRAELAGQEVEEKVWQPSSNGGSFVAVKRIAHNGGFCGHRDLQVVVMDREKGQDGWESIPIPEE